MDPAADKNNETCVQTSASPQSPKRKRHINKTSSGATNELESQEHDELSARPAAKRPRRSGRNAGR